MWEGLGVAVGAAEVSELEVYLSCVTGRTAVLCTAQRAEEELCACAGMCTYMGWDGG